MAPPDPNSPFMRKMKAAVIEHEVAKRESSRRAEFDEGELRPYNRAVDYYAVLGLEPLCSAAEVRRAFRRRSLRCHPDKQLGRPAEEVAAAAAAFAALKEAHEVLCLLYTSPSPRD